MSEPNSIKKKILGDIIDMMKNRDEEALMGVWPKDAQAIDKMTKEEQKKTQAPKRGLSEEDKKLGTSEQPEHRAVEVEKVTVVSPESPDDDNDEMSPSGDTDASDEEEKKSLEEELRSRIFRR